MAYVIHNHQATNIHEIQMKRINSEAIRQLFDISTRILNTGDSDNIYMVIDARECMILLLRLLAHELRSLAHRDGQVVACIAIVIANRGISEETSKMMQTILERDRVELFTDIEKARFWLQLEMKRKGY